MTLTPSRYTVLAATLAAFALAGCGSSPTKSGGSVASSGGKGGGYYKDDGPEDNPPANLDLVPDALPQLEPLASGANKPYVIFGKRYVPDTTQQGYTARGVASWYGKKFHGARTSNGEIYDMYAMTAAHPTMPIPSYARVTRVANNKSVIVRINDRGPFHSDRLIDLSYTAAHKLGILGKGSSEVVVELLMPAEIARIRAERSGEPVLAMAPAAPAGLAALSAASSGASGAASSMPVASNYTGVATTTGAGPEIDAIAMTVPVEQTAGALPVQILAPTPALRPAPRPSATVAGADGAWTGAGAGAVNAAPGSDMAAAGSTSASTGGYGAAAPSYQGSAPVTVPSAYRPTPVSAPLSSGIYLQVGAFNGERNAEDLVNRIRSRVPEIESLRVISGGSLHRVQVGPYPDREAAMAAAQRMQARVDVTPVIVTR
jgi:rare lipoprotein A